MAHREEREDTSSPVAHCAARRRHRKQRGSEFGLDFQRNGFDKPGKGGA